MKKPALILFSVTSILIWIMVVRYIGVKNFNGDSFEFMALVFPILPLLFNSTMLYNSKDKENQIVLLSSLILLCSIELIYYLLTIEKFPHDGFVGLTLLFTPFTFFLPIPIIAGFIVLILKRIKKKTK